MIKDIPLIKGRYYVNGLVEEGEHEHQDFKFAISDARKIARSISAFANNDGGRLLVGVKDNGVIAGVRSEEDIYMIETAAETFCRPSVSVEFTAFKVDPGVVVIRAVIPRSPAPPVSVVEEGGQLRAYYRVADENILAHPLLLSRWRHQADRQGTLLQLTDAHRALIDLLREREAVTLEEYVFHSHLSTPTAIDIIGRLAAASVVTLRYVPASSASGMSHALVITT